MNQFRRARLEQARAPNGTDRASVRPIGSRSRSRDAVLLPATCAFSRLEPKGTCGLLESTRPGREYTPDREHIAQATANHFAARRRGLCQRSRVPVALTTQTLRNPEEKTSRVARRSVVCRTFLYARKTVLFRLGVLCLSRMLRVLSHPAQRKKTSAATYYAFPRLRSRIHGCSFEASFR